MRWSLFLLCGLCLAGATASAQENSECQECHGESDLETEDATGKIRSLFINPLLFGQSVHADFECIDCHADATADHPDSLAAVDCSTCHDDAVAELNSSVHGDTLRAHSPDAPGCQDCHGNAHAIRPLSDSLSWVAKSRQAATCAACHENAEVQARNRMVLKNPVALYEHSIHGQLVKDGNLESAICSDCHTSHAALRARDPRASIHKLRIAETCAACHADESEAWRTSIHADVLFKGAEDAPSCIDCHGEHDILRPENPVAPTSGFNVATQVCSRCHASERLARKYGFAPERVKTFADSYHGLALRGGKLSVANCGSCHGVHDILPSSDPASMIHPENLGDTCGSCHVNAANMLVNQQVHFVDGNSREVIVIRVVRWLYIALIIVAGVLMTAHNFIDFRAKLRSARASRGP